MQTSGSYEIIIERDLDLKTIYAQKFSNTAEKVIALEDNKIGLILNLIANLGGLFIVFYLLFLLLTTCLTAGKLEDYLVSELFLEASKDDQDFQVSKSPTMHKPNDSP